MGFMALATIASVGGALAFNHPHKVVGITYYGYRDASTGDNRWALTPPSETNCSADFSAHKIACTITSTTDQATVLATTNAFPANYTIQNASANEIYR